MVNKRDTAEAYLKGLAALCDERFEEAVDAFQGIAGFPENFSDPVMANDYALALMAVGRKQDALSILGELVARENPHPFTYINHFYFSRLVELSPVQDPPPEARIKKLFKSEAYKRPSVSVIMTTYNRPEMIRESLESVLGQTFKDFELLVVNDGGDEAVQKPLSEYDDPRIVYISAEHRGLSSALNVGLSQAAGEWIAYLDDDDVYYPDHLETLMEYLGSHPDARAAYTDMYRAYQSRQGGGSYRVVRRVLDYGLDMDRARLRTGSIIPNRNPLIHHKNCIAKVGGYHEGLEYTMDWDFSLRLSRAYEIHHVKKVTGEFRTRSDASQMTALKGPLRNYCRNMILYLNNISPLNGSLMRVPDRGDGEKLTAALARLIREEGAETVNEFELRKLWAEPFYSLFYEFGKQRKRTGAAASARRAFKEAIRLAPYEPRAYTAWAGSFLR